MDRPKAVISLCDLTGNMTAPWTENGYHALLVDPQHPGNGDGTQTTIGTTTRISATILDALPAIKDWAHTHDIHMVFGFPPCTDVAVSGSRWFDTKRAKDPHFQAKAALVAEQCRTIGGLTGARWFFENPVSVFSSIFGKPNYTFHPSDYTAFESADNYTKKTCLWAGGGFVMPHPARDPDLGPPDATYIHHQPPGPDRANIRSATPLGFARAVFAANAPQAGAFLI